MAARKKENPEPEKRKKKQDFEEQAGYSGTPMKVLFAIGCFGCALLLLYVSFAPAQSGTAMGTIRGVVRGIGGSMSMLLALMCVWVGVLLVQSARSRRIRVIGVIMNFIVFMCVFTGVQLFSTERLLNSLTLRDFANYIAASYRTGTGGGAFGGVCAYPLYENLGAWGGLIAVIIVAILALTANGYTARFFGFLKRRAEADSARRAERRQEVLNERMFDAEEPYVEEPRPQREVMYFDDPPRQRGRSSEDRRRSGRGEEPRRNPADNMDAPRRRSRGGSGNPAEGMEEASRRGGRPRSGAERSGNVCKIYHENYTYEPRDDSDSMEIPKSLRRVRKEQSGQGPDRGAKPAGAARRNVNPAAAPVEATPVDATPVEAAPVDATPVDVTPVDVTPVDITPADPVPEDMASTEAATADPDAIFHVDADDGAEDGIEDVESAPWEEAAPPLKPTTKRVTEGVRPLGVADEDGTIVPEKYEEEDEEAEGTFAPVTAKSGAADGEEAEYNYPPIDLLQNGEQTDITREHKEKDRAKAAKLIDTLQSFGIETHLLGIAHGPAVTRFELQPAPGIKVSRITSLADDIALSLAALSVRIEAPIPGKAAVGVEIPNEKVEMVRLRDVLESPEARRHPSKLAVGLGKDNSGRYIVADIAKMPHVLIAGQTGSGKSVCINSIITSILYRATPEEVRMILIDPKVVELSVYNDIPHLIAPVVTDPKKAASALDWAVAEMTRRYKCFAERGVRDIKGYNHSLAKDEPIMPQFVIIIDELADLMMVAPGEVEDSICRLAQLARAAGMHLVIATQRPSVNVVTGIIKANIPARIAFSVASQVDSRTMIDHGGAEKLLGYGDMLFVPPGLNRQMRVQGAWVSDEEVHAIVTYIKERSEATYDEDVIEKIENSVRSDAEREEEASGDCDPKLAEAVEIAVDAGQVSVSMLQRRMRVGYARAGRLVDEMEKRGLVSEADGAKPRDVLINRAQYNEMFGGD